jgi:hypothetical protein
MRHPLGRALGLAALLASCAHPVDAQVRRIFVEAGAIADNDRTNSRLTEHVAGSWTLVVGAEVQHHLGIRLTVDTPRETSSVTEGVYLSSEFPFPFRQRLTRSRRSMTFAVLADVHGNVAPRLRIAATCGIANVTHDTETIATRERIHADGSLSPMEDYRDQSDFDWEGVAFGVEADVLVTPRLAIVPEARVIYFAFSDSPDPYIYRAGIGLRWWF